MFRCRTQAHKTASDKEAGAKMPTTGQEDAEPGASPGSSEALKRQTGGWKVVVLLFALSFCFFMALEWRDVVVWVEGAWELKPERVAERERQIKRINEAEQYALIAEASGYYECPNCPSKVVFLHQGEVWKYGVTNQGIGRYSVQFLRERNLAYVVEFRGTYSQCLSQEKKKLFDYPLLPENIARPDSLKLVLPPGNLQAR